MIIEPCLGCGVDIVRICGTGLCITCTNTIASIKRVFKIVSYKNKIDDGCHAHRVKDRGKIITIYLDKMYYDGKIVCCIIDGKYKVIKHRPKIYNFVVKTCKESPEDKKYKINLSYFCTCTSGMAFTLYPHINPKFDLTHLAAGVKIKCRRQKGSSCFKIIEINRNLNYFRCVVCNTVSDVGCHKDKHLCQECSRPTFRVLKVLEQTERKVKLKVIRQSTIAFVKPEEIELDTSLIQNKYAIDLNHGSTFSSIQTKEGWIITGFPAIEPLVVPDVIIKKKLIEAKIEYGNDYNNCMVKVHAVFDIDIVTVRKYGEVAESRKIWEDWCINKLYLILHESEQYDISNFGDFFKKDEKGFWTKKEDTETLAPLLSPAEEYWNKEDNKTSSPKLYNRITLQPRTGRCYHCKAVAEKAYEFVDSKWRGNYCLCDRCAPIGCKEIKYDGEWLIDMDKWLAELPHKKD